MKTVLSAVILIALIVLTSARGVDLLIGAAFGVLGIWWAVNVRRSWAFRAIAFALPLLGFSTALWANSVIAVFIGAMLSISFLCLADRLAWPGSDKERGTLGIMLFIFALFLNFFTLRNIFPILSVAESIAALAGVFFAVSAHLSEYFAKARGIESLVLTLLLAEAIYFLYFLPSGYFSLAIVSSIWYFVTVDLYVKLESEPRLMPKTLLPELAAALALILMVIISSGFRAR